MNKYKKVKWIGSGATSQVHLVKEKKTGDLYVLKASPHSRVALAQGGCLSLLQKRAVLMWKEGGCAHGVVCGSWPWMAPCLEALSSPSAATVSFTWYCLSCARVANVGQDMNMARAGEKDLQRALFEVVAMDVIQHPNIIGYQESFLEGASRPSWLVA